VHVIFRDHGEREAKVMNPDSGHLRVAERQSDDVLDNLPPAVHEDGRVRLPAERLTPTGAIQRFRQFFQGGFADASYIDSPVSGERQYKLRAHEKFVVTLGGGQLRALLENGDVDEAARRAMSVVGAVNLLASFEAAAFRDALQEPAAAVDLLSSLARVLDDEAVRSITFSRYVESVRALPQKQSRVATWPVATILPFLAQPDRHMFLKPGLTREAADALGFDLRYDAAPNWATYDALLRFAHGWLDRLRPLGARDFIDVQSFLYVVSSQYPTDRAKWEEKLRSP
jgi:hypothetical protein